MRLAGGTVVVATAAAALVRVRVPAARTAARPIAPTARVANRIIPGVVTGCDTPVDRRGMELDEFLEDVIVTSLKKRARRDAAARAVAAAETAAVAVGKMASGDEHYTGMYPYLEHLMRWLLWRCSA